MRVPTNLANGFTGPFEDWIAQFSVQEGLMPSIEELQSRRFIARSLVPHVQKLSSLFNREDQDAAQGLEKYWKNSSNPANLRLTYFLYFMPSNLFRVAAVWSELARLGFKWSSGDSLRAIELGAGPATATSGVAAGEHFASIGLPKKGNFALIEQDKFMLDLGSKWAQDYFSRLEMGDWGVKTFHRTIDISQGPLLPRTAPKFNLWLASYFLNEFNHPPEMLAKSLSYAWEHHLEEEGLVILVEPALRAQSRKLLMLRKALLELWSQKKRDDFQILLPCLGHQACGALAQPDDWCHEEVSWWRPGYYRKIDDLAGLDRKTLPFSYLVIARSKRKREELLPQLSGFASTKTYRLVSPAHSEGKDSEFFICGQDGKRRARAQIDELERGDLLLGTELRGDPHSSRVQTVNKIG